MNVFSNYIEYGYIQLCQEPRVKMLINTFYIIWYIFINITQKNKIYNINKEIFIL